MNRQKKALEKRCEVLIASGKDEEVKGRLEEV
jgi:hypothetical protein